MSLGPKVTRHDALHFEKTLRMLRGFEALHPSLALSRWLVRVLGRVIQVPVLPVSNGRQNDSFRGSIASKLIRDDHPRPAPTRPQQLAKESDRGVSITSRLDQDVDYGTLLIHGSP